MSNQMRGQASALYLLVINLVGLGPYVLPRLTDYVFASDNQIHLSILVTTLTAHTIAIPSFYFGLRDVRRVHDRRGKWLMVHGALGYKTARLSLNCQKVKPIAIEPVLWLVGHPGPRCNLPCRSSKFDGVDLRRLRPAAY